MVERCGQSLGICGIQTSRFNFWLVERCAMMARDGFILEREEERPDLMEASSEVILLEALVEIFLEALVEAHRGSSDGPGWH